MRFLCFPETDSGWGKERTCFFMCHRQGRGGSGASGHIRRLEKCERVFTVQYGFRRNLKVSEWRE